VCLNLSSLAKFRSSAIKRKLHRKTKAWLNSKRPARLNKQSESAKSKDEKGKSKLKSARKSNRLRKKSSDKDLSQTNKRRKTSDPEDSVCERQSISLRNGKKTNVISPPLKKSNNQTQKSGKVKACHKSKESSVKDRQSRQSSNRSNVMSASEPRSEEDVSIASEEHSSLPNQPAVASPEKPSEEVEHKPVPDEVPAEQPGDLEGSNQKVTQEEMDVDLHHDDKISLKSADEQEQPSAKEETKDEVMEEKPTDDNQDVPSQKAEDCVDEPKSPKVLDPVQLDVNQDLVQPPAEPVQAKESENVEAAEEDDEEDDEEEEEEEESSSEEQEQKDKRASREEMKLQYYIRLFEKREIMEQRKKQRRQAREEKKNRTPPRTKLGSRSAGGSANAIGKKTDSLKIELVRDQSSKSGSKVFADLQHFESFKGADCSDTEKRARKTFNIEKNFSTVQKGQDSEDKGARSVDKEGPAIILNTDDNELNLSSKEEAKNSNEIYPSMIKKTFTVEKVRN